MASTSTAPQVLRTSGASVCGHARRSIGAWIPTGVVTADVHVWLQGTGMSFAGSTYVATVPAPRLRKNSVSGIKTSGPPVC
jgi:hypothetical protein